MPVETSKPTFRVMHFLALSTNEGIRANLDTIEEIRDDARIKGEVVKR